MKYKKKKKKAGHVPTYTRRDGKKQRGSDKLYVEDGCRSQVVSVVLVDERTRIGFIILFVFVQNIFLYLPTYLPPRYVCLLSSPLLYLTLPLYSFLQAYTNIPY